MRAEEIRNGKGAATDRICPKETCSILKVTGFNIPEAQDQ
jgi:hypothetical protein